MKLISCVVRPSKVDEVKAALHEARIVNVTVVDVRDHGPQRHDTAVWRGHEYSIGSSLKAGITVTVHDDDVDRVVGAIIRSARTGDPGDGHVAVLPVEHRYNIIDGRREVS